MKILSVVGARPNFMKIAPFIRAIEAYNASLPQAETQSPAPTPPVPISPRPLPLTHLLVHTGQHYDDRMSQAFFEDLNIPPADIHLNIGSGSHAEQVGHTMIALEKVFLKERPDWVVVVGDINATLAASVTAKKLNIKVCHIEAGLRSGDMGMPEEINRLVTDRLSDLLLTPDTLSSANLRQEGVPEAKIRFVGNIMIDTLEAQRAKAQSLQIQDIIHTNLLNLDSKLLPLNPSLLTPYSLITLHRPSNVDQQEVLEPIIRFLLDEVSADMPVFWPIHPRTQKQLKLFGLWEEVLNHPRMLLMHPLGYHDMLRLNMDATIMLTDSGGLQEECTVLGTPCLTLRWNTERPVTLREHGGASVLVGNHIDRIRSAYHETLRQERKPQRPPLWDGETAVRCVKEILESSWMDPC